MGYRLVSGDPAANPDLASAYANCSRAVRGTRFPRPGLSDSPGAAAARSAPSGKHCRATPTNEGVGTGTVRTGPAVADRQLPGESQ